MKKTIAQAKVCVISKLVKKLREEKKKLNAVAVDADAAAPLNRLKLAGRHEKFNEQINHLKRTANLDLARQCLVYGQKPHQVLTNPLSSNADVALAQLVTSKPVVARVTMIKSKYNLDLVSEDWRTAVAETGKKKQKRNVKEAHLKRKSEQKARQASEKEAEVKRSAWLVENGADEEAASNVGNDSDDDEAVKGDSDASSDRGDSKNSNHSDESDNSDEENSSDDGEDDSQIETKPKKIALKPKIAPKPKIASKPKIAPKPKPTNTTKSLPPPKSDHRPIVTPAPAPKPATQRDAFFVTASGSAYMASGIEQRYQPVGPNDGMDRRERRAQQFGGGHSTAHGKRRNPAAPTNSGRRDSAPTSQYKKPRPDAAAGPSNNSAAAAQLHPSWAAKQRTKGIANFQGSKKTFGDDDDGDQKPHKVEKSFQHPKRNPNPADNSVAAAEDTSKLHPSWLAKQKLKPVISAFQGKKITFGD